MVSTSTWHAGGPGSIPGHDRHGTFWCKNLALSVGDCVACELENHLNVGTIAVWDQKKTTQDDMQSLAVRP